MMSKTVMSDKGLKFSPFIQGYWRLAEWNMTPQQRLTFLKQHIELGVTTVDHADIYGGYQCERLFGEALSLEPSIRDQIQVVSKCDIKLCTDDFPLRKINSYDTSRKYIIDSVNNSLSRMNIESLDALLIHRPDLLMEADEVAEAFRILKRDGKVCHFGVSNFTASQASLLQSRLEDKLITNQVEINPLNFDALEDGTLDQLQMNKQHPMAWSCLAGGEIFSGTSEKVSRVRHELETLQVEMGTACLEQVIYAWILKLPSKPLPIIGTGKIERVKMAVGSSAFDMSREQWYRVWVAAKGHGVA